ncbi:MAG TPA: LapA family protein [Candidatus Binatia bacterium]|nr:LapA family protein [Candidatus Binatia bacterium]
MYLRTILVLLAVGALTLFTAVNWSSFTTPTTLSVIFATVEAPLGLVLLGFVILLAALFLIYVVYLQSSVLFETRRHARELHTQRELAERAEISRIHELRSFLETQLQALGEQTTQTKAELSARLDQVERDLRQSLEQCQNSLAASIAEIDDRLEHGSDELSARRLTYRNIRDSGKE